MTAYSMANSRFDDRRQSDAFSKTISRLFSRIVVSAWFTSRTMSFLYDKVIAQPCVVVCFSGTTPPFCISIIIMLSLQSRRGSDAAGKITSEPAVVAISVVIISSLSWQWAFCGHFVKCVRVVSCFASHTGDVKPDICNMCATFLWISGH